MRKGITPVIAIILLLLITISMVGFAFVWFTRVQQISTEQTQSQLQDQLNRQGQKVKIDNVKGASVTLRGSGTVAVDFDEIAAYVNDAKATIGNVASGTGCTGTDTLDQGEVQTCALTVQTCTSTTQSFKVTAPGSVDVVTCKT